jgi:glycosyltransferase involved in cell wall biosynthesis
MEKHAVCRLLIMPDSKKKLRVLMVIGSYPPTRCGVADYTQALCEALARESDLQVGVLTRTENGQQQTVTQTNCVTVMRAIPTWRLSAASGLISAIKAWTPHVVHFQYPSQGFDGLGWAWAAARLGNNIKTILTVHEGLHPGMTLELAAIWKAYALIVVRPNYNSTPRLGLKWTVRRPFTFISSGPTLPQAVASPARESEIRSRLNIRPEKQIVSYFGFIYPRRGTHQLFDIAQPEKHHLVIMGSPLESMMDYYSRIQQLAASPRWVGSCSLPGFLPPADAADVLANSSAIVLPFSPAGGIWNSSLHAARLQGALVITTADPALGYVHADNTYYAKPEDISAMSSALIQYGGQRIAGSSEKVPRWQSIAVEHARLYRQALVSSPQ